ncbi:MAG TPA: alpha-L-fucosidase [Candidatus Hydrogenedentes bacterium]|nr:alpha-L-fucosidase [Candidatus Hydrogenedentota bacterium]HQM50436.1 alpha-L-fucosidase [Candidatus Hydrogenedentota bacterium]
MSAIPKPAPVKGDMKWFVESRFGMFIHWGLYALPARHEWIKQYEEIPDEVYDRYFKFFEPDLFDPKSWARMAREAGMKYFVITTKHHEGFCLFDSKFTDYKATNTPCGKDLIKEVVDAFRAEGLRAGFYYSLIDWHHPDFPIDALHSMRNHPGAKKLNRSRDMAKYREYLLNQVRELLTNYGRIDIMWFDFSYPRAKLGDLGGKGRDDWGSEMILKLVRELQPHVIVDNRLDLPAAKADIHTPEQFQPREWVTVNGKPVHWETCQTFSGSWGYHRDESTWKSPEQLIQMLVNSVSCGGNLLMNVGPTARGTFDPRAQDALAVYRDWMALHGRSIYGCTQSEFTAPDHCRLTQNGKRLYVHLFAWPFRHLHFDGMADKVEYAQLLNDASEIHFKKDTNSARKTLILELPVKKPAVVAPVLELFLK